ncbi:7861_t:CDS:2 [Scutellospora calospora]|uniref:7861_t:CDS:1 n=1 Tax=Scutellospora calospora TaxID=85575 RepID=A0ACA9K2F0_9GLOM|nr:7861_t:CDS:2 [Scutellospora calospora]
MDHFLDIDNEDRNNIPEGQENGFQQQIQQLLQLMAGALPQAFQNNQIREMNVVTCFACQQPGHVSWECPNINNNRRHGQPTNEDEGRRHEGREGNDIGSRPTVDEVEVETVYLGEVKEKKDINLGPLTNEQEKQMRLLLERYKDTFIEDSGHGLPIKQKFYPTSKPEHEFISTEIHRMQKAGIIRPSTSPWASPIVLVRKKNGIFRFCVDFRKLNKWVLANRDAPTGSRKNGLYFVIWFVRVQCDALRAHKCACIVSKTYGSGITGHSLEIRISIH